MNTTVRILGLEFFQGAASEAVAAAAAGGLVVAPSGPGLAEMPRDPAYRAALDAADIRLLDSGLLALMWELRHGGKLSRISGYYFLDEFLKLPEVAQPDGNLWVAPSESAVARARAWLREARGIEAPAESWHIAPRYDPAAVEDKALLALVHARRPRRIFIAVGGGPQEKLGAWLKARLDYRPAILCTGAAIAFLTGEQARIPAWADRARLGWLLRCLQNPRRFVPRYAAAFRLVPLYIKCGDEVPAP